MMDAVRQKNETITTIKLSITGRSQSYDMCIGYDIIEHIVNMIPSDGIVNRYIIITDDRVSPLYGETLRALITRNLSDNVDLIIFPAGERSKSIQTALEVVNALIGLGADRKSALVALGGGVVGDLVGFVASLYMRGIPCFHVPTTLMAQVDSSIGGKNGIDLPLGKNLLGTFWQPSGVLIDIKLLESLPNSEYTNGLAEIVKYGIIKGEKFLKKLEGNESLIQSRNRELLKDIIFGACTIKKEIVEMDERDHGLRGILNFGHTVGHALESASGYRLSHGNAIAIGMIASARLSYSLYGLPLRDEGRIETLIVGMGLENRIPEEIETEDILTRLRLDKKKEGDSIRFVMLRAVGEPFVSNGMPVEALRETIEGLRT